MPDEPDNNANGGQSERAEQGTQFSEDEIQARIAKALESNQAYKGLQTAFNRSNERYQQQLAAKDAEIAQLKSQTGEMAEGLDFLSNKFIRALPPEQQAAMADELRQRKIAGLEKEVNQMRQAITAPRPQAQPQFDEDQLRAQFQEVLKEAQDALEDTARNHGLDPKDKVLDYGTETETFAARLKKLNASIKKAEKVKEERELESVRAKTDVTPTRTTGGQPVGDSFAGKSFWELGSQEVWERMRQEARTGKRR